VSIYIKSSRQKNGKEVRIYVIYRNGNFFSNNNQQFTTTIIDQWYSTNIQYCPFNKESDTMPWLNFPDGIS